MIDAFLFSKIFIWIFFAVNNSLENYRFSDNYKTQITKRN